MASLYAEKLHGDNAPLPYGLPATEKRRRLAWKPMSATTAGGRSVATGGVVQLLARPQRRTSAAPLGKVHSILQADASAGFDKLYESDAIQKAPCLTHIQRKFYDLMEAHQSSIATETVKRIAALCKIEAEIRGRPAEARRLVRLAPDGRDARGGGAVASDEHNVWPCSYPATERH